MATHLDIDEQEKLDQIKAFWRQYGGVMTWILIAVFGSLAAWNGWNWWQRDQAIKASAMYDELDRAASAADVARATQVFNDLKERYPRVTYAQQAGLLAARLQHDAGQLDDAGSTLAWVAQNAKEAEYRTIARLRLASILLEQKKFDEALKQLDASDARTFEALVADRRGDVLLAQGNTEGAIAAYKRAWDRMEPGVNYRQLVEAKLISLAAAPEAVKPETAP